MKGVPDRCAFSFPIQMASHRLPNYLRMYRKRACLTQAEVARLLGTHDGANVSRYERYKRTPNLETALAYRAVFRQPIDELLAGIYNEVERRVRVRARRLRVRVRRSPQNLLTLRKLETLDRISTR